MVLSVVGVDDDSNFSLYGSTNASRVSIRTINLHMRGEGEGKCESKYPRIEETHLSFHSPLTPFSYCYTYSTLRRCIYATQCEVRERVRFS